MHPAILGTILVHNLNLGSLHPVACEVKVRVFSVYGSSCVDGKHSHLVHNRQNYLSSIGILMLPSSAEIKKDGAIFQLYCTHRLPEIMVPCLCCNFHK
jgi:hypothetical protein